DRSQAERLGGLLRGPGRRERRVVRGLRVALLVRRELLRADVPVSAPADADLVSDRTPGLAGVPRRSASGPRAVRDRLRRAHAGAEDVRSEYTGYPRGQVGVTLEGSDERENLGARHDAPPGGAGSSHGLGGPSPPLSSSTRTITTTRTARRGARAARRACGTDRRT